jgi:hypothetical protein
MSLPELFATLDASRKSKHDEYKFMASLKGIDLDKDSKKEETTWEDIKARAFSGGRATDAKDIMALSGKNAQIKGFGIGQGLEYAQGDETEWWKR